MSLQLEETPLWKIWQDRSEGEWKGLNKSEFKPERPLLRLSLGKLEDDFLFESSAPEQASSPIAPTIPIIVDDLYCLPVVDPDRSPSIPQDITLEGQMSNWTMDDYDGVVAEPSWIPEAVGASPSEVYCPEDIYSSHPPLKIPASKTESLMVDEQSRSDVSSGSTTPDAVMSDSESIELESEEIFSKISGWSVPKYALPTANILWDRELSRAQDDEKAFKDLARLIEAHSLS